MLTLKSIELSPEYKHGFDRGARPSLCCRIEFQLGEKAYNTIKVDLPPEAVARVIAKAIEEASYILTCDASSIDVEGAPGVPETTAEPETAAAVEPL